MKSQTAQLEDARAVLSDAKPEDLRETNPPAKGSDQQGQDAAALRLS